MKKYFILVFILFVAIVSAKDNLNLYIGTNYIADATIDRIQKNNNCELVQNYFNDPGEMLAKIVAGVTGYNIIVATSYTVSELAKMGKLMPLDKSKLTNLKNLDKSFLNEPYDIGNVYSVPYAYTPVFLAYNEDKMKALGVDPNSWAVIFDPKILVKLKGHVTVFSSARNVFAAALLYLHKDPNSENPADLDMARQVIDKASPYWAKFDSDSYYRGLLRGDIWISMSYSIDIFKAMQDAKASNSLIHLNAKLQKEGNMYELDNLVIPSSTPSVKLSYAFINAALESQSEFELAKMTGSSVPNLWAINKLDKNLSSKDWIYPKDMSKMFVFKDYMPKTRILQNEMWTEILMQCR